MKSFNYKDLILIIVIAGIFSMAASYLEGNDTTIMTNKNNCCSMTITHHVLDEFPNTYDIVYYDYITGTTEETREFSTVDKDYVINMFQEHCGYHHNNNLK